MATESKLNFNTPLLSTRRIYKTAVSVRRNKSYNFTHDDGSNTNHSPPPPSVSGLVSEFGLDHVNEPLSVTFTWEQAPGRSKGQDLTPRDSDATQQVLKPCLPPGKVVDTIKCPVEKPIDGNLQSSKCRQVEESDDNDDDDDVFSDARDMLSLKDSFISGVSSGYGVVETTAKKKKTLYEDHQSRDYMLSRFLPAAKAMEQPHYASNRKPSSFMSEPTIHLIDLAPEEKRKAPKTYDESIVPPYYYHQDNIDDEESDKGDIDDEVSSEYAYLSKRGCGMLPQQCFKESITMMNTIHGFKAKPNNSSVTSTSHDQVKSSKAARLKSRFQSVKKMALGSVSKQKPGGETQSPVHPSLVTIPSRSSSPYRQSRCMSPYRNAGNSSPFRKETENMRAKRLNSHIRNISTSHELLYSKNNGSTSSLSEKTVHVDSENPPMAYEEADKAGKELLDTCLELEAFENISMVNDEDESGQGNSGHDRSHIAPPSPKKPSESWLLHKLPWVNTQIPSSRYQLHRHEKQDVIENSRNVTKWETIVKTSHMHRDHIRYSQELGAHTSHQ
ncbi:unnamed protein product [Cochlearia groenlandica]